MAFVFDTAGGVLFAKFLNLFLKKKINPMIGAAGISAFPMSGRVVHKMGLQEDPQNFLLMHAVGVNVSGQIASVIAGGLILMFFAHEEKEESSMQFEPMNFILNLRYMGVGLAGIFIVIGLIVLCTIVFARIFPAKKAK